jgi:signal transduction histidine kinase
MGERRSLPSVRVRITAAATLVTAVTVVATGWLLLRTVENTQLGDLADRTQDRVDDVARALAAGRTPQEAVGSLDTDVAVQVLDERGCPAAVGPVLATVEGPTAMAFGSLSAGSSAAGMAAGGGAPSGDAAAGGSGTLTVHRADGTTIVCPLPAAFDVPAPGPGADGRVTRTAGTPPETGAGAPEPGGASLTDRLQFISEGSVSRFPFERVSREVSTPSGTYTIEAAAPVDEVRRSIDAVRSALWWALPALIAVVAGVAWVLVGRALRPVEAIRAEVESIGGATMHRRVSEPRSRDEVGRLARTMNAMLARLEASARRQRQFVSDASHELRSPVAAIRADVEVAELEGASADWPAVASSVLREEARLERLIDDLLVLAAADEGGMPARRVAPVDVTALVADDASRARRVPVEVEAGPAPALVVGDSAQLRRVVGNLVDNAARHARSRVAVGVSEHAGVVQVRVDDDGTGIAPADRARVFERFARLDEGRARDQGGTGLGLAVVHSLVTRHGGTVGVGDSPAGGARLVVDLPAGPTPPATAHALPPPRRIVTA